MKYLLLFSQYIWLFFQFILLTFIISLIIGKGLERWFAINVQANEALAMAAVISLLNSLLTLRQWRIKKQKKTERFRLQEGRCPTCGYPLTGLPQPRCPECGQCIDQGALPPGKNVAS